MPASDNLIRLIAAEAVSFAAALLRAGGADPGSASTVAEHLVESDRSGVHSHGLMRVSQYVDEMEIGEIAGRATPRIVLRRPTSVVIDGDRAFGQVAAQFALRAATACAAANGIGLATVRRAGHAGRIGAYVESPASAGNLAVAFCSGPRSGHRVAPFGGIDGRLATNPIAFGFPGDAGPVVADFSTSTVPEGAIRRLRELGSPSPDSSIQDATGAPTLDPAVLYEDPPGTILPLGGPHYGHKGFALGLLVEVMTTVLSGEDAADDRRFGNNLTVLILAGDGETARAGKCLAEYVRSARPVKPDSPVLLPGDIERDSRVRNTDVPVDSPTWQVLNALAQRFDVDVPEPVS